MAHRPIGKTKIGASITIGSVASDGLEGTYRNIDHHANSLRDLVDSLMPMVQTLPIREWRQFNNVHYLCTHDSRYFYFRPLKINGKYTSLEFGIRVEKTEHNKALRVPLFNYFEVAQLRQIWQLIATLTEHVRAVQPAVGFDILECAEA